MSRSESSLVLALYPDLGHAEAQENRFSWLVRHLRKARKRPHQNQTQKSVHAFIRLRSAHSK
jgi:hypothetical protein